MIVSQVSLSADQDVLIDERVRDTILATARAIAERVGVELVDLVCDHRTITASVRGEEVVAVGFASELRRVTEQWHRTRYGTGLWSGTAGTEDDEP